MLSPKTLKTYFSNYMQRVIGITHVFCLVTEAEIQKRIKSIPTGSIALIIIVPSYDSQSPDRDNVKENAPTLMMLVKRIDRKDDTEDSYLDTLDEMTTMMGAVRYCMMEDKFLCGNIMRNLSPDGIHTDPEIDYYGCFGYSMSFVMADYDFSLTSQQFIPLVPKVTITDGAQIVQKQAGEAYVCVNGNQPAHVIDQGVQIDVLPGETHTCSLIPLDGEAHNTDQSVSIIVPSGANVEVPDEDITNSENVVILTKKALKGAQASDIAILKSNGIDSIPWPAGKNYAEDADTGKIKAVFEPNHDLTLTYIIESDDEGTFIILTPDNIATYEIKLNSVVQNFPVLPMALATGDEIIFTIIPTDSAVVSSIKISY